MKGTIKIKIKDHSVKVIGRVANSNVLGQTAVLDSLMRAFDLTGHAREIICNALVDVDKKRCDEKQNQED